MSIFAVRLGLALMMLAALCLGGRAAHAQAAPVTYWLPGWPVGFGGNVTDAQSANTYGDFPSFDAQGGRFSYTRYSFPNGWFVGNQRGPVGLSMNGIGQYGAFGNINSLYYQGTQFGYKFQNNLSVYAGFDTLKYNTGMGGNPFAPFDSMSGVSGYSARAGFELQPSSNVSLSLGFGYTQRTGQQSLQSTGRISDDPFSAAYMPLGGGR